MDEPKTNRDPDSHVFDPNEPTPEDLARARDIPVTACPRRYCWWWHSIAFDWSLSPAQGCEFLQSAPSWGHANVACRRADESSTVDHFEPREPYLKRDGFDDSRYDGPQPTV